jgi:hypothetical protein
MFIGSIQLHFSNLRRFSDIFSFVRFVASSWVITHNFTEHLVMWVSGAMSIKSEFFSLMSQYSCIMNDR